jgi:YD repeat-containing protein
MLDKDAGGYTLTLPDGATERYDPDGRRLVATDRAGKTISYAYDAEGRLQAVTGPFGRSLTFAYDANGHMTSMTDPASGVYRYDYDANDNLTRVIYPDGTTRLYHYEDNAYDAEGKAILTQRAGGQQQFTLNYDSDTQSTVTDAIGTQEIMTFAETLGVRNLLSRINQTDGKGLRQVFDDNNNLIEATDAEGRITTYTYNANNQRLTMTAAAGAPEARTTTFAYVSEDIDLPTQVTTPSVAAGEQKEILTTYDASNNPIAITQAGFTPEGVPVTRTITMAYNALGQVIQIDGPRTDVSDITTLTYYDCNAGAECGQLQSVTNALGHTTAYERYDAHGRVTRLTDPNGVVTTFTYDLRGRVLSITRTPPVGPPRTTTSTYDRAGQLIATTTPDGLTLTNTYDAAHNLVAVSDNLGNKIEYDYNLKGNRIAERTLDPDETLARNIDTTYDIRNRVASINAAGSMTQLINDAVGNLVSQTDPNANPPTNHSYDGLDRLIATIDALGATTGYGYDINDRITRVSAPNNATTLYLYDDLGNLLEEQSPDRGTLAYSYDGAGNIKTLTDARGITATYGYDALNRISVIDYPGTVEDITFTYDTCLNGSARLCTVRDESGTMRLSYDPYGNVVQQVHTELGIDYTTAYTYDAGDAWPTAPMGSSRLRASAMGSMRRGLTTNKDD